MRGPRHGVDGEPVVEDVRRGTGAVGVVSCPCASARLCRVVCVVCTLCGPPNLVLSPGQGVRGGRESRRLPGGRSASLLGQGDGSPGTRTRPQVRAPDGVGERWVEGSGRATPSPERVSRKGQGTPTPTGGHWSSGGCALPSTVQCRDSRNFVSWGLSVSYKVLRAETSEDRGVGDAPGAGDTESEERLRVSSTVRSG